MDSQNKIAEKFTMAFGRTPIKQRLEDILGEAIELSRFVDIPNLKEEAGDLLCSTIQLCNECGWNADELIDATLTKIDRRKEQYKSLGRKTKIAALGGAFNPITLGHIEVARYVLNTSRTFDEVWLFPCCSHMFGKEMASPENRVIMCNLAIHDPRIKVCDYEIRNRLSGETYQTVKLLLEEDFAKNQYDFSWIIGMDNANVFDTWVNYELLEKMIRFVVVPREGYPMDPKVNWYLKQPHIFLASADKPIMEVSSTEVRSCLEHNWKIYDGSGTWAHGNPLDRMLDPAVYKYIIANKLYQP